MKLFSNKATRKRTVDDIINGLSSIVSELDASIAANEMEKETCAEERQAEINRHEIAILELSSRDSHLDSELNQASTVKSNLAKLLGID